LVFLIGDACGNASLDIIKMKKKFFDKHPNFIDSLKESLTEKEAGQKYNAHSWWTPADE
jgi:hypothetical protein